MQNAIQESPLAEITGVDLSKILEGQTQILGERNVVKTDKCMGVSRFFLGGRAPGLPPKSTTMAEIVFAQKRVHFL